MDALVQMRVLYENRVLLIADLEHLRRSQQTFPMQLAALDVDDYVHAGLVSLDLGVRAVRPRRMRLAGLSGSAAARLVSPRLLIAAASSVHRQA